MGFENRDYYKPEDHYSDHFNFRGSPCWQQLIVVTAIAYIIQVLFTTPNSRLIDEWFAMETSAVLRGQVWRLVSYSFLHANPMHMILNMVMIWFFAKEVESKYGPREFLGIYLMGAVFGGLATIVVDLGTKGIDQVVGASSSVLTIITLFVVNDPRRIIYFFWGMFAVQARWLLAIYVFLDLIPVIQALNGIVSEDNIANAAHLGGFVYGYVYFKFGWNPLTRFRLPAWKSIKRTVGLGPRLRVVRNEADEDQSLRDEVDTILEKIQREGEASLTKRERNVLIEASKRFKNRT